MNEVLLDYRKNAGHGSKRILGQLDAKNRRTS